MEKLVGEVIKEVIITKDEIGKDDEIVFKCESGKVFRMFHRQDCCESVYIETIDGDIKSIVGEKILSAYESTKEGEEDDYGTSTWTFYNIDTLNHSINIRWFGSSNGYYSEAVTFEEVLNKKEVF